VRILSGRAPGPVRGVSGLSQVAAFTPLPQAPFRIFHGITNRAARHEHRESQGWTRRKAAGTLSLRR
jgi:hypothetical protein